MLRHRILSRALGYEDINDHDRLRLDPLLAAAGGWADVLGEERHLEADRGRPLAGKGTLNWLELGAEEIHARTKRIQSHPERIEALLLALGVADIPRISGVIVLDFDATDDPLHTASGRDVFSMATTGAAAMPGTAAPALRAKAPPFGCLAPLGSAAVLLSRGGPCKTYTVTEARPHRSEE